MTFALDIDLRQIGQGIYNYVQAGLNEALPRWAEMAADTVLDNWRLAATGRMYPGMTRTLHSEVYRIALERGPVQITSDAALVTVSAPERVQMSSGQPFNLHSRIEFGGPAYSIRAGWLRKGSAKTRIGRNGAYVIIPFRHGSGESVHFQSNMDPTVRRLAQSGAVTERRYRGAAENPWSSAATRFARQDGPAVHLGLGPRFRKTVNTNSGRFQYTWQRAILAGVRRYGRAGQGQYVTFRTMSESGSPNSWVVPALPANPVAQSVTEFSRGEISRRIREDMEQMSPGGMRP